MAVIQQCALVLWGAHGDEAAAAVLISILRAAGLRVWVVGISGRQIAGAHGLRLQPDLTPMQALPMVAQARCVLIPCADLCLTRFCNDPNVAALLTQAQQAQALFVLSPALAHQARQAPDPIHLQEALIYPHGDGLFAFAATLAATLTNR